MGNKKIPVNDGRIDAYSENFPLNLEKVSISLSLITASERYGKIPGNCTNL